jgi:indolepyruvate ferredoxin oxidoreductase alpha subunit
LGDEAIAQGAIDAGMSGAYGFPGTPSSEIIAYVQQNKEAIAKNIHRKWASNEKTGMEAALGMSYAGKRAIVTTKHVGLNVAADGFVNSAITGVNGGLIVVVADDPSMHSSQNEQDSRFYAKFSFLPSLEPSSQQEAYDMMFYGFEFSEKVDLPIMMRIVTRLAHSRAGVTRRTSLPENKLSIPQEPMKFVLLPSVSRKRYKLLLEKQAALVEASENSPFNVYTDGKDKSMGIIACGLAYNYLTENYENGCPFPVLKISQYPLPQKHILRMFKECDSVMVLEEGAPMVEEMLKGYLNNGKLIKGRLDGTLPRDGELNPNLVAQALGLKDEIGSDVPSIVKARPPIMCEGCSHIDVYNALKVMIDKYGKGHVFSDIGCYTLGALPPYSAIDSCVDMGASITMAKGASDAGLFPSIAVIGDSTFTHSGITGLLDCVNENTNVVIIISDNETTAMTGGQDSSALNRIEAICSGVGVDPKHIRVCVPLKKNHDELVKIMQEEIDYNGVSVIIPRRECIQTLKRKNKK